MHALAASLLVALVASVAPPTHARPLPALRVADTEVDPRLPKPRVSPGDVSGDTHRPPPALLQGLALEFTPNEQVAPYLARAVNTLGNKRVSVAILGDERRPADRSVIGRNALDGRTVTTRDDVGGWCSQQLTSLLEKAGVEVVPTDADLAIAGKVRRFFVDEGSDYVGTVILRLTVTDAAGNEVWSGQAAGAATNWGRTYKAGNYLETLSDAFLRAVDAWLADPRFVMAVGK